MVDWVTDSAVVGRRLVSSRVERGQSEAEKQLVAEVEDLKCLHTLSLRLANQSLVDVLNDVLRTAASLVGAQLGTVQLISPEGGLSMVGEVGFGDSIVDAYSTVRLDDCSTCAEALRRRSRVIVPDLHADSKFAEIAAALMSYGAAAAVSTPVLDSGGKVLAMFSVYWLKAHEPSDRDLRVLDLCADLAGRHVERDVAIAAMRDRQNLLMRELAHRGKNLVSVIQSIATRSLSGDLTLDEAREVFIGRLQALANTYNTLTDECLESAPLHDIVSAELKSIGDRTSIRGPAVAVQAKAAQTLALVFHELATNAAKYGSLSVPSGRIDVAWNLTPQDSAGGRFRLEWKELGGPPVNPSARKGFGTTIITRVLGNELDCEPHIDYAEYGFRYFFECSLSALTGRE